MLDLGTSSGEVTARDLSPDLPIWSPVASMKVNASVAKKLAEADSVVELKEELRVSDAPKFQADLNAAESIKESIAKNLGVSPDGIVIRKMAAKQQAKNETQTGSLLDTGSATGARRTSVDGTVDVTVDVICGESESTEECYNKTSGGMSAAALSDEIKRQLRTRNVEYTVAVEKLSVQEVDTKTHSTLRETVVPGSAKTCSTSIFLLVVVLLILTSGFDGSA